MNTSATINFEIQNGFHDLQVFVQKFFFKNVNELLNCDCRLFEYIDIEKVKSPRLRMQVNETRGQGM